MSTMADEFVQSFLTLSNKDERLAALNKLVRLLSSDERKAVADDIQSVNDIVPAFPFELLVQVFNHLHFLDTWSLQLVNRRWHGALSSDESLGAALSRWNTHDPADSGRSMESIAHDPIQQKIRHMQSLRLGKPFTQAVLDNTGNGLQGPQPQLSHRKLDLKGRYIAYISSHPGEGDTVVKRDLVTGSEDAYHGDARERILSLALSTSLLAFVTFEGYLHVYDHAHPSWRARRQLPSASIRALGVGDSAVALALGQPGPHCSHVTEVLLFDIPSSRLKSFDIAAASGQLQGNRASQNSCAVVVDCTKKVIDIFVLVLSISHYSRSLDIIHMRVSFDGDVVKRSAFTYRLSPKIHVRSSHFTMAPPVPTGYCGRYRIQVGEISLLGGLPLRLKFDACFDADTCEWILQSEKRTVALVPGPARELSDPPISCTLHAQWKTLALRGREKQPNDDWLEYYSLMNDTFFVSLEVSAARMSHSRLRIFSFDPKIDLHWWREAAFSGEDDGLSFSKSSCMDLDAYDSA